MPHRGPRAVVRIIREKTARILSRDNEPDRRPIEAFPLDFEQREKHSN